MNAYYQEKLKQGLYYQDFVIEELYKIGLPLISYSSKEFQVLIGENKAGLEIKNDNNYKKTGNLYIETAENPPKQNSIIFLPASFVMTTRGFILSETWNEYLS